LFISLFNFCFQAIPFQRDFQVLVGVEGRTSKIEVVNWNKECSIIYHNNKMSTEEYSKLTIELTKQLSKKEKKDQGIFITPRVIINKLLESVKKHKSDFKRVLEPSCGTGEIIQYINDRWSGIEIDGVEFNTKIYERVHKQPHKPGNAVSYKHGDFMKFTTKRPYDLVVGNPPYVVVQKEAVPSQYEDYIVGRPNLFGLFILHSISMLKSGGILAFIIPKSFLNAAYYSKIRDYMKSVGEILDIVDFEKDNKFIDTQQSTFGIIWRKRGTILQNPPECRFSLKLGEHFMFTEDATALKELFVGSTTLSRLGLSVKTGTVVWNERKPLLTDDKTKTVLIYNSNLTEDNKIVLKDFKNDEKKQYIQMDGQTVPTMVVNRGNGNAAYRLQYALVDGNKPYLIENHLNMIVSNRHTALELSALYRKIEASFRDPRTKQFVEAFLGNNGLSKTELETIFPIYM